MADLPKGVRQMLGLSLHGWENTMVVFLIVAGFFAFVAGAATWAVVRLQRIELAKSALELEQYKVDAAKDLEAAKTESDAKIAVARAESAAAIEKAQADIAKAVTQTAKANERAAALEKEAANARAEQERLKAQLAWRRLTKEQHDFLVAALRPHATKLDLSHPDDSEAALLASEIEQTLKEAGWTVSNSTGFWAPKPPIGIIVGQQSDTIPHPLAKALADAGFQIIIEPGLPADQLKLIVGVKPPAFR
jgi:hypothetical protein